MNITYSSELTFEKTLAGKLEELFGSVPWLRGWRMHHANRSTGFDLTVILPLPKGGRARLWVECKREIRPSTFKMLVDKPLPPENGAQVVIPVLGSAWMSPRMIEMCAEKGWSWFDLAGNHCLDIPGVIRLQHTGNEPVHKRSPPKANLSTAESGRVIRALLIPDHTGKRWTQGELQEKCHPKVSQGLVNKVVNHLLDEAFLTLHKDRGFQLTDPLKLLYAWGEAYRIDHHERRAYFTLLQGKALKDALARFYSKAKGFSAYASFSAAEYQAPHVRQAKTWLYVREQEINKFENLLEAKMVDSGENLTVFIPEDEGVFYASDAGKLGEDRIPCTNPVQTYVDLPQCGARGEEAAEALLEQRLKPEWKRRGLKT